ncbi:MAG TPA: hypothetical protein VNC61_13450 [Acidimicrobiales bacterium]|nr:hypothetical protein [Acidimicrobiales bacterium]
MTIKRFGRGCGVVMTVLAVVGIPSMSAFADSTCYVGCTPPTTQAGGGGTTGSGGGGSSGGGGGTRPPVTGSKGSGSIGTGSGSGSSGSGTNARTAVSTKSSGGALPFTGADVEEMTAVGAGALLVGGILVRRGRHRRRAGV